MDQNEEVLDEAKEKPTEAIQPEISMNDIPVEKTIITFAKQELRAAGYDLEQTEEDPDKWIVENILELLEVFSDQGHSGSSAPYCIAMFSKLAAWEPLTPLQGTDDEWVQVDNENDEPLYQNKRASNIFKQNEQAYDINGKVFREPDGCAFTSRDSRVNVTFPYTPVVEYVEVIRED